jgi:hypothetical protein
MIHDDLMKMAFHLTCIYFEFPENLKKMLLPISEFVLFDCENPDSQHKCVSGRLCACVCV